MSEISRDPKEFALSQIAPYYKDPMTCGYDGLENSCRYLTEIGTMCVAGKNMLPHIRTKYADRNAGITGILEWEKGQKKVFNADVVGILTDKQWRQLQSIHDEIARFGIESNDIKSLCKSLNLFELDELIEYAKKLK